MEANMLYVGEVGEEWGGDDEGNEGKEAEDREQMLLRFVKNFTLEKCQTHTRGDERKDEKKLIVLAKMLIIKL